jgi:hypothetical protein
MLRNNNLIILNNFNLRLYMKEKYMVLLLGLIVSFQKGIKKLHCRRHRIGNLRIGNRRYFM